MILLTCRKCESEICDSKSLLVLFYLGELACSFSYPHLEIGMEMSLIGPRKGIYEDFDIDIVYF